MPSKEIKELRQSGRLEEALAMAQAELDAQPDNIWGKRNISWVYYEYLKKNVHEFNYEVFVAYLKKLQELNLPENEVMVFDTAAWQIASLIFKIQKQEPVDYSKINELFDIIKGFHFTKPSEGYSLLYRSFHKGHQNWSRYLEFADWWGLDNLRPEDYLKEEYNDRQIMALAEQAYIAYSKALIEGEALDAYGEQRSIDTAKIEAFLPKLDEIITTYPDYQYPPYFKAKLLLTLGDEEDVLRAFLPFAKKKRNDFWVWELMSEIFEKDLEIQFACLCKALSLKTPEDFLIKTRQKFAELLIEKQMHSEARTEIQKIIDVREKNKWKIPNKITQWVESDWFKSAQPNTNNNLLYSKHIEKADEILFRDIPEEKVVVEFINQDKKILNFIKSKTLNGFFSYKHLSLKPSIGDLLLVRLQPVGNDGFFKVLTIKETSEDNLEDLDIIKNTKGTLRQNEGQNFAFVEDIFISPDLIDKHNLKNNEQVEGLALLSLNKKKNEWGWKLIKIINGNV